MSRQTKSAGKKETQPEPEVEEESDDGSYDPEEASQESDESDSEVVQREQMPDSRPGEVKAERGYVYKKVVTYYRQ